MTFPFRKYLCAYVLHVPLTDRIVISVEHFAIASAGFFVLLASFAVQKRDNFIRLR